MEEQNLNEAGSPALQQGAVSGSCFSKGDWYVGRLFPLPDIYCNGKKVAVISKELPIEEREANARMMAAAPDLFEAVDQLLSRIVVSDTWDKKAVLVAKAALQKATGHVA